MPALQSPAPSPRARSRPADPVIGLSSMQMTYRAALLAKLAAGEFAFEEVPHCLCGATGGVPMADHDRFGIPIGVLGCPECGLLRTSPRLAADDLPAFYESHYHGLHFGFERPSATTNLFRHGQGATIWAVAYPELRSRRRGERLRVVDIGAANGAVLRELAIAAEAAGLRVEAVGCEYSPAFAAAARELGTDVRVGGIESLMEIGGNPDLVIMSHVLEHFSDPLRDLQLVKSLVGPQTLVYVEVPGLLTIHAKPAYGYQFGRYLTLAHTYYFTLVTLVEAMERAGFVLVRGDEEVRALFRLAPEGGPMRTARIDETGPPPDRRLSELQSYLRWLKQSPRMRWRRAVLHARRDTRLTASRAARRILGERGFGKLRQLLRG